MLKFPKHFFRLDTQVVFIPETCALMDKQYLRGVVVNLQPGGNEASQRPVLDDVNQISPVRLEPFIKGKSFVNIGTGTATWAMLE